MMKVQDFRQPLNSGFNYSQRERSIFLQGKFIIKRNGGNKDWSTVQSSRKVVREHLSHPPDIDDDVQLQKN
jgi:hypothetical protein